MTDEIVVDEAQYIRRLRVGAVLDRWNKVWLKNALETELVMRDVHLEDAATLLGITYEEAYARRRESVVQRARNEAKNLSFGFRYAKPFTITDFIRHANGRPFPRHVVQTIAALGTPSRVVRKQDRMVQRPSVLIDNLVWEAFMRDIVVKSR